jgi:glycine cleavage system aminomethyltransferase T
MELKLLKLAIQNLSDRFDKIEQENLLLKEQLQEIKKQQQPVTYPADQKESVKDEYLALKEAIGLLNISRSGFLRMVGEGLVNPIRYNLRTVRYSRKELLSLIRK